MSDSVSSYPEGKSLSLPDSLNKRMLADTIAKGVFTLGGWIILLSICAILFVISAEVIPLFKPVGIEARPKQTLSASPVELFLDDYQETGFVLLGTGEVEAFSFTNSSAKAPKQNSLKVISASRSGGNSYAFGTSEGTIVPAEVKFIPSFLNGNRTIAPSATWKQAIAIQTEQSTPAPIQRLAFAKIRNGTMYVAQDSPSTFTVYTATESRSLMGGGAIQESQERGSLHAETISGLALDKRGEYLLVGTQSGTLHAYHLKGKTSLTKHQEYKTGSGISAVDFALGGRTVLLGQANGAVSSWLFLRSAPGKPASLKQVQQFQGHSAPVTFIDTSLRNKVFVTGDRQGTLRLHYATTGKTLTSIQAPLQAAEELTGIRLAPKANGLYAYSSTGSLFSWLLDNPHPEVSLKTLFAPIQYEGYTEPAYVWQSTGGTDDFEIKISLVPLIVGTLKGTFYALLFSLPIALLAAFYTSQFMPPRMKSIIKPILEIMAALPSVVIGFVAGLWLAPKLEPHLFAVFCVPVFILLALILACFCVWKLPKRFGLRTRAGTELFVALPVLALTIALAFPLSNGLETFLFAGDFTAWLYANYDITVDQRNSIIAGIAVGFAVVPIIFTISEDCLSSVPRALSAGSLALGATRWQTATRVIFPIAAPGIFAAVMIGLGRAVGETMIVLMATGNTPLMDFSAFTGFRALSANIAVELPEAPQGGTLYRVLFLTALILFVMTFILNTISEFVRSHLRKKYGGI